MCCHVTGFRVLARIFMWLRTASIVLAGSTIVFGEVGVICYEFGLEMLLHSGEIMTMTLVRCLDKALFVEVWVVFLVCATQCFCDGF
jgi:hypothetical protein